MTSLTSIPAALLTDGGLGRLVRYPVDQLYAHPCLVKLQIVPTARELSNNPATSEPLTITQDRYILAGQARWENARRQGEISLPCLELQMTEQEALLWLIQKHQRSSSLNDFSRILLALELEAWFRARARVNQQSGGQLKASSNLTEADRLDVRAKVATAACVSVGNVSTVKKLLEKAVPEVLEALREGEVSIHRASLWLKGPGKQLNELSLYRNLRFIRRTITSLQRRHVTRASTEEQMTCQQLRSALGTLPMDLESSVLVRVVKVPGEVLMISTGLLHALQDQGELPL